MPAPNEKLDTTLPPTELLLFSEPYRVLICSSCRYAVQPDAIARHLKEIHHIHRDHKRPYLQHASTFQLADPQEVFNAQIQEFPIPLLPILDGLLCGHHGCRHLCGSAKRMKSHFTSAHARISHETNVWVPVPMQTFFRGNLLSYFTDPHLVPANVALSIHDKCRIAAEVRASVLHGRSQTTGSLSYRDTYLLQHYIRSTSQTLASDEGTEDLWRAAVPQLAARFDFLMHGILACAALHLAHLSHKDRAERTIEATAHFDAAIPLYRSAIAQPTPQTSDAILVFAHLLVINSFALQDADEPLLLASADAVDSFPAWLYFIRNGCSMLCDLWEPLSRGPVRSLVAEWEDPAVVADPAVRARWAAHLRALVPRRVCSESMCRLYGDAADALAYAFACSRGASVAFTVWHVLRIWPVNLSEDFIVLLGSSHPAALILVAHYCLLLRRVEKNWYFAGRAMALLDTIRQRLGDEWRGHISFPLQEMDIL